MAKKGGKKGKGKGQKQDDTFEEVGQDEGKKSVEEVESEEEEEEEEEMDFEEEDELQSNDDENEEGDEMSDDMSGYGDMLLQEATSQCMQVLAELPSPEYIDEALQKVKEQVKTLLYTSQVSKFFTLTQESKNHKPFTEKHSKQLQELFQRCMVHSHTVFKDDEWVIGSRKAACGASTSLVIEGSEDEGDVQVTMTWYWREDEHDGFVEEFSLVRDGEEDEQEKESADGQDSEVVTILEGTRTNSSISFETNIEALQELESKVKTNLPLQTLIRFVLLCTRTECNKLQGKFNSITQGYDEEEDGEDMSRFLCSFTVPKAGAPKAPQAKKMVTGDAGKKRGGPSPSKGGSEKNKKQRR